MLLADGRRVAASAKALTTHWNLAIGIGDAMRAVLDGMPAARAAATSSLVSVSTTLATNAVVENRFSPVCTLLIGFDEAMVERSGLKRHGGAWFASRAATVRPARRRRRWTRPRCNARCASTRPASRRSPWRRIFGAQSRARIARAAADPRAVAEAGDLRPRAELQARRAAARADGRA